MNKPREFWIDDCRDDLGLMTATDCIQSHEDRLRGNSIHVREVLPPSADVEEMAERYADGQDGYCDKIDGFKAGHASRDAEVAELKETILEQDAILSEVKLDNRMKQQEITALRSALGKAREKFERINKLCVPYHDQTAIEYDCMNYSREAITSIEDALK